MLKTSYLPNLHYTAEALWSLLPTASLCVCVSCLLLRWFQASSSAQVLLILLCLWLLLCPFIASGASCCPLTSLLDRLCCCPIIVLDYLVLSQTNSGLSILLLKLDCPLFYPSIAALLPTAHWPLPFLLLGPAQLRPCSALLLLAINHSSLFGLLCCRCCSDL